MSDTNTALTKLIIPMEDEVLYEKTVLKMRQEIAKGKTFAQACKILKEVNEALRPLIQDDFLKIIIAEQHFVQGRGIDDVALFLDLPYETIATSREIIMSDFSDMMPNHSSKNNNKTSH